MKHLPYLAATLFALALNAGAETAYQCKVLRVSDGDTLICDMIPAWPAPVSPVHVRVAGIDTPESLTRNAKCDKELRLGKIAKAEMVRRVPQDSVVRVVWTGEHEKFGRVLAKVTRPDGKDWASELIRMGMARAYDGGHKSSWCK